MKTASKKVHSRRDPICGMHLKPNQFTLEYTYYGITYVFCSSECRNHFLAGAELYVAHLAHDPDWYLGHTCPHQEIALALDL
ncbi:MAG: YHS domain-containing protein [Chloroflexi bacterium]|nr:YHS domain-containing protein [Chloroflexota bacterium]